VILVNKRIDFALERVVYLSALMTTVPYLSNLFSLILGNTSRWRGQYFDTETL